MIEIICKFSHQITPAESDQIGELSRLAYTGEAGPGEEFDQWADTPIFILGLLDQRIVSLLGLLSRQIIVGDQTVFVAGLGGVATHPDFQRRGYASLLMERAREYMQNEIRAPFGMLVCSPHREAFYQSLGWQTIHEPMLVETRTGKRLWPEKMLVLPLTGEAWPAGPVDILGIPW